MATKKWRGDAMGVAQVDKITVANIEIGDIFTVTCNRKSVSFTAITTIALDIYTGLAALINTPPVTISEFTGLTALALDTVEGVPAHIQVTGPSDGEPFTLTVSDATGGVAAVNVVQTTLGDPGDNETQTVTLGTGVTGGTFTATFQGITNTGTVAWNASAATFQTELETMSNVAAGDIVVTGNAGGPWTLEFTQAYAATNVAAITINAASLTGGSILVETTQDGGGGQNEIQKISIAPYYETAVGMWTYATQGHQNGFWPNPADGQLMLEWKSPTQAVKSNVGLMSAYTSAAALTTLLETHSGIQPGDVSVTLTEGRQPNSGLYYADEPVTVTWEVEFIGRHASVDVAKMQMVGDQSGTQYVYGVGTLQNGDPTIINEIQVVEIGDAAGGTFTLSLGGATTAANAYNISAATLKTNLDALSTIDAVTVTGTGPWTVEWTGTGAATDIALMTGSGASLTGVPAFVNTTQEAVAATNEIQEVSLSVNAAGGTFTLTFEAVESGTIAWNASAATMETALELVSTINAVSVTGDAGGPWAVEFQGNEAGEDVGLMVGDGDSLTSTNDQTITLTSDTTPTGPNYIDNAANWSTNTVPATSDVLILEDNAVSIRYGLAQSAVTVTSLIIKASYTGEIGLPTSNAGGYIEYLPTRLAIGATTLIIGEGVGGGSDRIRLDTGSVQTAITVWNSGEADSSGQYAVDWIGTHASSTVAVYKGEFGSAMYAGEVSTILTLTMSYDEDNEDDSLVHLGKTVTLGTVVKRGGELITEAQSGTAITSITTTAGHTEIRGTDGVSQLTIEGGECLYLTSGTLAGNTTVDLEGQLIFEGDERTKTVTNLITILGDAADVSDSNEVVTSLVLDYKGTSRFSNIGNDFTLTRS